jgi:HAD superfamily hydrolase (TIGR01549 family)
MRKPLVVEGKKAVIYDMDNTLVATDLYVHEHLVQTLKSLDMQDDISKEEITSVQRQNLSFEEMFKALFEEDWEKVLAEYRKTAPSKPYFATEGAVSLVNDLKAHNLLQGILTNRTRMAEERLAQAGFPKFDFIFSPPSEELRKPNPKAFDSAMAWLKEKEIGKKEIFTIGDHIHDYKAAKELGLDFFAVLTGQTSREEFISEGLRAGLIFKDMESLSRSLLAPLDNMAEKDIAK